MKVSNQRSAAAGVTTAAVIMAILAVSCGDAVATEPADLTFTDPECGNSGEVTAFDEIWMINDLAPPAWKNQGPIQGAIEREGDSNQALFTAGDGSGSIAIALDSEDVCHPWPEE